MEMKTLRAVIVDDVRVIRTELKMILSEYPQIEVVGEAANALEAVKKIGELKPDVLFLDIHLPGKSGFDLLDEVDEDFKVIFVSSYIHRYSAEAKKYDPVAFLSKPLSKDKLKKAILELSDLAHIDRTP